MKKVLLRGLKNIDDAPRRIEKYRRCSSVLRNRDGAPQELKNTDCAPERAEK
jgi:hypothetical protein